MTKFFINLYNYFQQHKIQLYLSLVACVCVMTFFATKVKFEENVTSFFPDTKGMQNSTKVFKNLKVKDKIIVMFSASSKKSMLDKEALVEQSNQFEKDITARVGKTHIKDIFSHIDEKMVGGISDFVYDNLPLFLTERDYQHFDSLLNKESIEKTMEKNYSTILSPTGIALKNYIMRDPLGLANGTLKRLQNFQLEANYNIENGYIFSKDGSTLLLFITPIFSTGSTGENDKLIKVIEEELSNLNQKNPSIKAEYFGGPSVGVYNARQIKKDTMITLTIALVIIIGFMSLVFKRKRTIPLIIAPVLFGGLFSLFLIYFLKENISAIAVGTGSVVFGIALSYSIHMLAHQNHVSSVQQLIKELAYPLTVGSFTTIGAFFGLMFTSSELLRDFGLFASLTLVGTTLFCLIYLPHFLKGQVDVEQGRVLRFIEKINAYSFEKNKWLIAGILILTLICLFTSQKVTFNDNMMSLNYEPKHLKQSEDKLMNLFDKKEKTVLFVSVGKDMNEALKSYTKTNRQLSLLKGKGVITDYASAELFIIPQNEQQQRLDKWNTYWTPQKKVFIKAAIQTETARYHFKDTAFDNFYCWMDKSFTHYDFLSEKGSLGKQLNDWQVVSDSITMLVTQVRLSETAKAAVYKSFKSDNNLVIFDRAYFANKWVSAVNNDFYLILYISSFLIFFALLISYGRIELTLISFLPMLISWVIILGLMGILGIQFNIINIILSTFIFGIGDDFSIFIMDGLQSKYRTGQKMLNSHKTAIFFSAFTTVVGMGALIFARHPALQSISFISIIGMMVVVLVAYTIQPLIFHLLIVAPTSKGLPPYTLFGLIRTSLFFLLFLLGCVILRILISILYFIPIKKSSKKSFIGYLIMHTCRCILLLSFFVKKKKINVSTEDFKKPSVLVANHQSYIDILVLLSLSPKIVMFTNSWVWNSPFFGAIIRFVDFYYVGEGYERNVDVMKKKVQEGYSIAVFPEGTRAYDEKIKRFHKGGFYLAEMLQLDIIPIVLYGNGKVIAKAQPFNIRSGIAVTKILSRISYDNELFGKTYQERAKRISAYMKNEYAVVLKEYNVPGNPYLYNSLIQNYIYKGPVEEWYIRIKVRMEKNYRLFNDLVPTKGQIVDIGCGLGPLCYMLSMLSGERHILGIDYDEDKIAVAQHGWARNERIRFICADAINYQLPESDVFILNDMLHYMNEAYQEALLKKCAGLLHNNGMIIVRDGNTSDVQKHRLTQLTELFSTKIIEFNKTAEKLCFISEERMIQIGKECKMDFQIIKNDKYTSNMIYIFRKRS